MVASNFLRKGWPRNGSKGEEHMIDKLILSAVLGVVGFNGLFPDPPQPVTSWQLQVKAKQASKSEMCAKKKKSKTVKKLCERWGKYE
jgi:hypothetical protein